MSSSPITNFRRRKQITQRQTGFCYNYELAEEGKINEAENELYMGMVEDDVDYLELALTFYLYLNDMDGDFLDDNGYSREEVLEGMKDLASDWGVTGLEAF